MTTFPLERWKTRVQAARLPAGLAEGIAAVGVLLLIWSASAFTARPVRVTVDGIADSVTTHRRTVGALLADLGLELHPADRVSPAPETPLRRGQAISIERARPVRIQVDGRLIDTAAWGETPAELLAAAGITLDRHDQVTVDNAPIAPDAPLPPPPAHDLPQTYDRGYAWSGRQIERTPLRVDRATAFTVVDSGLPFELRTTAETVGAALRQAQITLYLGDRVQPSLGHAVSAGLRVTIDRSRPLVIEADGRTFKTRSQAHVVADALAELGVSLNGLDRVEPAPETPVYDDIRIQVTRVSEEIEVEEEIEPFDTLYVGDPNLAIDTQEVQHPGAEGITRSRTRVRYENGQEVTRTLEDTWIAQEPTQRRIAYGQNITPQTAVVDGQTITYWRKVRMWATSYSADTAGTPRDAPNYGRTATGDVMRKGIVAVDPKIIPLRSQVYVSGYGVGDALDTGGAIRARIIDMGYDDHNRESWNRWVDVYLLWPPPPNYSVTWVIPNYPRVPE